MEKQSICPAQYDSNAETMFLYLLTAMDGDYQLNCSLYMVVLQTENDFCSGIIYK
jgi:hypothetical protein